MEWNDLVACSTSQYNRQLQQISRPFPSLGRWSRARTTHILGYRSIPQVPGFQYCCGSQSQCYSHCQPFCKKSFVLTLTIQQWFSFTLFQQQWGEFVLILYIHRQVVNQYPVNLMKLTVFYTPLYEVCRNSNHKQYDNQQNDPNYKQNYQPVLIKASIRRFCRSMNRRRHILCKNKLQSKKVVVE